MTLYDHLPASVRVGPYDIALIVEDAEWYADSECFGVFKSWLLTIQLTVDQPTPLHMLDTLIHEIMHAVWFVQGIKPRDSEERKVTALATAWTQIHRDNPWLLDVIRKAV